MRVTLFLAVLLGIVSTIAALPAAKVNDDVEIIPSKPNTYGDQPIIDTGVFQEGPFFSSNPFGGLFGNLEGMMTRIKQQIDSAFNFQIGSIPNIPQFPPVDLGKGNTTSVTKVIDGHKVTINETEYKKEDDFGGSFFKVRIVNIAPEEEVTTEKGSELVGTSTTIPKDTELVEDSRENEISKSNEPSVPEKLTAA
ncbi:hypothetical protein JTB14_002501 [Gonioctena quinquepunctata]|nr:hypothetical protein JTB14_002501 [Gonioctena quinquepunctata]